MVVTIEIPSGQHTRTRKLLAVMHWFKGAAHPSEGFPDALLAEAHLHDLLHDGWVRRRRAPVAGAAGRRRDGLGAVLEDAGDRARVLGAA